jgi:hypothetical protein
MSRPPHRPYEAVLCQKERDIEIVTHDLKEVVKRLKGGAE